MRTVLEALKNYNHICWYPSAGRDFRSLLFISDWYCKKFNLPKDEGQELPDLYILTDYSGFPVWYGDDYDREGMEFLKPSFCLVDNAYYYNSTKITVKTVERLRDLNLSFDRELASFDNNSLYNSAFLIEVEVESMLEGVLTKYDATILYVTALNEAFYKEFILPNQIKVEYQVLVRYGEGICGGAKLHPAWIIRSYKELGTRYLISEVDYVTETSKEDKSGVSGPVLERIYTINGKQWSQHDEIGWYKIVK